MMNYKYEYTTLEGIQETKYFETKKEAMSYLNFQVRDLKNEVKGLKISYLNNSKYFYEKEFRSAKLLQMEEEGLIDLGEDNKYSFYSFEITDISEEFYSSRTYN